MNSVKHYYNEHNAYRAAVLRERMEDGLLPQGVVDERDIETIPDEDFLGYTQVHLFAGIGYVDPGGGRWVILCPCGIGHFKLNQ